MRLGREKSGREVVYIHKPKLKTKSLHVSVRLMRGEGRLDIKQRGKHGYYTISSHACEAGITQEYLDTHIENRHRIYLFFTPTPIDTRCSGEVVMQVEGHQVGNVGISQKCVTARIGQGLIA